MVQPEPHEIELIRKLVPHARDSNNYGSLSSAILRTPTFSHVTHHVFEGRIVEKNTKLYTIFFK